MPAYAGLIRELEEKRVVVLPVLMEDCKIPLFLRDKMYADFRTNFDDGLKKILESIARVTSDSLLRVESDHWHVDWAVDWGLAEGRLFMSLLAVEQAIEDRFTVVTEIQIIGNERATERYHALVTAGLEWVEKSSLIQMLADAADEKNIQLHLSDEQPETAHLIIHDEKSGSEYLVNVVSRRVGEDSGRDILLNIGGQLRLLCESQRRTHRTIGPDEAHILREVQRRFEKRPPKPSDYIPI